MKRFLFRSLCGVLLVAGVIPVWSQLVIEDLDRADPVYQQHQEIVAGYHRAIAQGTQLPPMLFLTYRPKPGESLYEISSRLMLPYSTLATLNRLSGVALTGVRALHIPTRPGVFVYETPDSALEQQLSGRFADASGASLVIPDSGVNVRHFPGTDFLPEERRMFLQVVFDHPLITGVVSSPYGYRNHPITGVWSHHEGIDFAADFGTPVGTAAEGQVTEIGRDPWLGLSITIDHRGEYRTRYAHLQETFVSVGTFVERGATIGTVGSTGLSTGPHLHFEVLYRGESRDPVRYLLRD